MRLMPLKGALSPINCIEIELVPDKHEEAK